LEDRKLLSVFTVDHLADDGQGTGLNGDLRYCLTNAADADVITFGVVGVINLTRALPNLSHGTSIVGPGANNLTVRRNTGGDYSIFTVASSTPVSIWGLTIANGGGNSVDGGGIHNIGTLTVINCVLSGNGAHALNFGGGIFNDSGATMTVLNSTVSGNTANIGAGIFNQATLTVLNSTLSGNRPSHLGGGIFNSDQGTVTLVNSTLSGNTAEQGGGIDNQGTLIVINSTASSNLGHGGGIAHLFGTATIINSTLSDNSGGGIFNGTQSPGTLTVVNSTVSGNTVEGGIANGGPLTVINSTISGNSAVFGGGGIANDGPLTVINSTISRNSSASTGGGVKSNDEYGTFNARNTIIAGNTAQGDGPDLSGALTSQGHNLIGNTQGGSGFDPSDLLNVNAMLGPLQDNGGPTKTMALLPGSPALDAGDNTDAPDWDQRGPGFPRIVNSIIDIGAFEVQSGGGGAGAAGRDTGRDRGSVVAAFLPAEVLPGLTGLGSLSLPGTPSAATSGPAESCVARSSARPGPLDWVAATPTQVVDHLFVARAGRSLTEWLADDLALA
jgi:hypothetical protein